MTIEQLYLLQKHYNELSDIKNNMKAPLTLGKIKGLGSLLKDMDIELKDLQNRINISEKTLKKSNMLLRDLEFRLEDIEKSLYKENITDIKQLTILDREREIISKDIENLETDLLNNMESIDKLKKEYNNLMVNFNKNRKEYTRLVKEHRGCMKQYSDRANREKQEIEKLTSTINADLLKRFENLIRTKKVAVVEVIDNRCSGCNMVLPSVIMSRLKGKDEIVLCENCHRILYLP